ncbi:MAG: hypothetical protein RLZ98_749 [Pseudomonadota bacterium]|jgi:disulfide bond formation protein DsbB
MIRHYDLTRLPSYQWGMATLLIATGAIVAALLFEHIGGYTPCPLCLMQRYAYYVSIPLILVAVVLASGGNGKAAALILLFVSIAFLANAGLGVYHAGAEWKFWPGPETCAASGDIAEGGPGFRERISQSRVIRCDEAPFRLMGLSFAGWNVVICLVLSIMALKAAFAASEQAD